MNLIPSESDLKTQIRLKNQTIASKQSQTNGRTKTALVIPHLFMGDQILMIPAVR